MIDSMPSPDPTPDPAPHRSLLGRERDRILRFFAERGAHDVRVFGSVARGDDLPRSDIDLLIELTDAGSAGAELMTVLGLSEELSLLLGVRVHVVTPRTLRALSAKAL